MSIVKVITNQFYDRSIQSYCAACDYFTLMLIFPRNMLEQEMAVTLINIGC